MAERMKLPCTIFFVMVGVSDNRITSQDRRNGEYCDILRVRKWPISVVHFFANR